MNTEIPVGGWLYIDSGILTNGATGDPRYYVSYAQGRDILYGDMHIIKDSIINQFKQREPQSTIEVTWLEISWESAEFTNINMITGYWFTKFRIRAAIKNVNAGLAPAIIAAIIIAVPIIIAITTLCATIAWVSYSIVAAAGEALGPTGIVGVGLIVLLGLGVLLFFVVGGSFSKSKTGFSIKGRKAR
jgi:hypothetical protein